MPLSVPRVAPSADHQVVGLVDMIILEPLVHAGGLKKSVKDANFHASKDIYVIN